MVTRNPSPYNRLQPVALTTFTGGLNLRRNQFQLADTETPDMLNIDVDPRGGFSSRKGWLRWNADDIVDVDVVTWQPRNAYLHTNNDGSQVVYIVNGAVVYKAAADGVFSVVAGITAAATPHGADFATWDQTVYVANGMTQPSHSISTIGTVTALGVTFSEVDAPVAGMMPHAEFVEAHGDYLFVACTIESAVNHFSRIRWSHPSRPDSWRELDFLDIDKGGGRITALVSFQDHLLIFKTTGCYALYGYDEDSWQLVTLSEKIGCPAQTAVTRSETAVYFFSSSNKAGIYAYNGDPPVYLSEKLRTAFEQIDAFTNCFVSWAGRRLWVSVPWMPETGGGSTPTTTFVLDIDIGDEGAWTQYRSIYGSIASVLDGSDANVKFPLANFWSTSAAGMITLDAIDGAFDQVLPGGVLGVTPDDDSILVTDGDIPIAVTADAEGQAYDCYYRTPWLTMGMPDLLKSWRRPTFICRRQINEVDLIVESYRDYDETTVRRSNIVTIPQAVTNLWTTTGAPIDEGIEWTATGDPPGGEWTEGARGGLIKRGGPMGHAAALQLRVRPSPSTPRQKWGVDGIVMKILTRRTRT